MVVHLCVGFVLQRIIASGSFRLLLLATLPVNEEMRHAEVPLDCWHWYRPLFALLLIPPGFAFRGAARDCPFWLQDDQRRLPRSASERKSRSTADSRSSSGPLPRSVSYRDTPGSGSRSAVGFAAIPPDHIRGERCNILVGVRARPVSFEELSAGEEDVWVYDGNRIVEKRGLGRVQPMLFNQVYPPGTTTDNVYETMGQSTIDSIMKGYNGTIFAYGQTSSGKTYTLMGTEDEPGMTILAVHDIFQRIKQQSDTEFLVRVSYLEIHNEEIRDLLRPEGRQDHLRIVDSHVSGPHVRGLTEEVVISPQRVLELLRAGEMHRHVATTSMNVRSSRSHTLFRMVIESRQMPSSPSGRSEGDLGHIAEEDGDDDADDDVDGSLATDERSPGASPAESVREGSEDPRGRRGGRDAPTLSQLAPSTGIAWHQEDTPARSSSSEGGRPTSREGRKRSALRGHWPRGSHVRVACLNMVDLAGSERVSKSGATGDALKESGMINTSLLTLGTVISKLTSGADHIPYRDSKLTRLLSTSLGGNAKTAVVVTISPTASNLSETRSSLQFASRAMKVVNRARVNEISGRSAIVDHYRKEIAMLRAALLEGGGGTIVSQDGEMMSAQDMLQRMHDEREARERAHEDALEEKQEELAGYQSRLAGMQWLLLLATHAMAHLDYAPRLVSLLAELAEQRVSPEQVQAELQRMVPALVRLFEQRRAWGNHQRSPPTPAGSDLPNGLAWDADDMYNRETPRGDAEGPRRLSSNSSASSEDSRQQSTVWEVGSHVDTDQPIGSTRGGGVHHFGWGSYAGKGRRSSPSSFQGAFATEFFTPENFGRQLRQLQKERDEMAKSLKEARDEVQSYRTEWQGAQEELEATHLALSELADRHSELKDSAEASSERATNAAREYDSAHSEVQALRQRVASLERTRTTLQAQLEESSKARLAAAQEAEEKMRQLQESLDAARHAKNEMEETKSVAESELEEARRRIQELDAAVVESRSAARTTSEQSYKVEQRLQSMQEAKDKAERQVQNLRAAQETKQIELDDVHRDIAAARSRNETVQREKVRLEEEVVQWEDRVTELSGELEAVQSTLAATRDDREEARRENAAVSEKINSLEHELERESSLRRTTAESLSAAETAKQELEGELSKAREALSVSQQRHETTQARLESAEADVATLTEQVAQLQSSIDARQADVERARESHRAAEARGESLKNELEETRKRLVGAERSVADLEDRISHGESHSAILERDLATVRAKESSLQESVARGQEEHARALASSAAEVREWLQKFEESQEENGTLRRQLADSSASLSVTQQAAQEAQEEVTRLQHESRTSQHSYEEAIRGLQRLVDQLKEGMSRWQQRAESAEEEQLRLTSASQALQASWERERSTWEAELQQWIDLQQRFSRLQQDLGEARSQLEDVSTERDRLEMLRVQMEQQWTEEQRATAEHTLHQESRIHSLEREVKVKSTEARTFHEQSEARKQELDATRRSLDDATARTQQLESENSSLLQRLHDTDRSRAALSDQLHDTRAELDRVTHAHRLDTEKFDSRERQWTTERQQLEASREELWQVKGALSASEGETKAATAFIDELQSQVSELRRTLESERQSRESSQTEAKQLSDECQTLRKRVAMLEEDVANAQAEATMAKLEFLDRENQNTDATLSKLQSQLRSVWHDFDEASSFPGSSAGRHSTHSPRTAPHLPTASVTASRAQGAASGSPATSGNAATGRSAPLWNRLFSEASARQGWLSSPPRPSSHAGSAGAGGLQESVLSTSPRSSAHEEPSSGRRPGPYSPQMEAGASSTASARPGAGVAPSVPMNGWNSSLPPFSPSSRRASFSSAPQPLDLSHRSSMQEFHFSGDGDEGVSPNAQH